MRHTALTIILAFALGSCAIPQYTPTHLYTVRPDVQVEAQGSGDGGAVAIRPFAAGRAYGQDMVYFESPHILEAYPNARWAEKPADWMTQAVADALRSTGHFNDVADAMRLKSPDYVLTGTVRRFDEDRMQEPPVAVCEIRLELRHALSGELVLGRTLRAEQQVERSSPAAFADAMARAVEQVARDAARALAAAEKDARP